MSKVQLKCDGTQWRTGGEVKGKLTNGVGSQRKSVGLADAMDKIHTRH